MERFRTVVDLALEWTLLVLMSVMVLNVLWQVATRFLLRDPSSYTEELARYLLIWVGMLGAAYAAGKQLHLAIDLLPTKLAGRSRSLLRLFIELTLFVFALVVLVVGGSMLVRLKRDASSAAARRTGVARRRAVVRRRCC